MPNGPQDWDNVSPEEAEDLAALGMSIKESDDEDEDLEDMENDQKKETEDETEDNEDADDLLTAVSEREDSDLYKGEDEEE